MIIWSFGADRNRFLKSRYRLLITIQHSIAMPYQLSDKGQESTSLLFDCEDLQSRIDLIDSEIRRCELGDLGEPAQLYETANHLLLAGGKRLRSLLVLLACEAVGGTAEKAIPFAIATEMIQTASLIHDDIIDGDYLRRGVETVHQKYGLRFHG